MTTERALGLQAEYKSFLDALPAFVVITAPDGSVMYRNRAWRLFTGVVAEDGTLFAQTIHPDDREAVASGWRDAHTSGGNAFDAQYRIRSAVDGAYHWVRTHTSAVRDDRGRLLYYAGVGFVNDEYEELHESKAQLGALFNGNVVGILTATIDPPLIVTANDEFLRMVGYDRDDLQHGRLAWNTMTPPEWAAVDGEIVEQLLTRGYAAPFEKEYFRKDGSRVPILLGTAVFDAKKTVIGFAIDLSERKRATQRFQLLAELGRRLSTTRRVDDVYEAVTSMVVSEVADWAVVNVRNDAGDFVVGAARHRDPSVNARLQALVGERYLEASGPSGSNAAMGSGRPVIMRNYSADVVEQAVSPRWRDLILSIHPHSSVVVPLIIGGDVYGTLTVNASDTGRNYVNEDADLIGDIGLRMAQALENARGYEAERALLDRLSQSEREYRTLADVVPIIVFAARGDGWLEWYNRGWYEFTGQTPEEAAGWGWQAAHHPEDLPRVMDAWPRSLETGEPFEMEFRLRRYDGVFHTVLMRIHPVKDEEGRVVRWYGGAVDIQPQKVALERTRRIAETLQGVFLPEQLPRTPLLRIDGFYQAAETDATIGGDWFDAIALDDGCVLLSIGDVAGHGLDASVIAGRLRFAVRDYGLAGQTPEQILALLNRIIMLEHPHMYATAVVAIIDSAATSMTYSCAGHPPPIFVRNGRARTLPHGGLPLGVANDWERFSHRAAIERNDAVAFYTDGVVEFARDMLASERRLAEVLEEIAADTTVENPAARVRDAVLGDAEVTDDAALLLVQFSSAADAPVPVHPTVVESKHWRFHSSDAYTASVSRRELMSFVREHVRNPQTLFDVELILGELLANAVEHAPGLVEIELQIREDSLAIAIEDSGPGFTMRDGGPRDLYDEHGRGLFLVRSLARSIDVTPLSSGGAGLKVELPLD